MVLTANQLLAAILGAYKDPKKPVRVEFVQCIRQWTNWLKAGMAEPNKDFGGATSTVRGSREEGH